MEQGYPNNIIPVIMPEALLISFKLFTIKGGLRLRLVDISFKELIDDDLHLAVVFSLPHFF